MTPAASWIGQNTRDSRFPWLFTPPAPFGNTSRVRPSGTSKLLATIGPSGMPRVPALGGDRRAARHDAPADMQLRALEVDGEIVGSGGGTRTPDTRIMIPLL
jgi:hypothetical protein